MDEHKFLATLFAIIVGLAFYVGVREQSKQIAKLRGPDTCPARLDEWPVRTCPDTK